MSISELRALYRKYHMSEQLGIVAALFMAVISYLPLFITWDLQQLAVVGFFLVLFIIRLGLYIWNRSVRGTGKEESSQAKMMLTASILLLIMQSTFMAALFYQLMVRKRAPLMASIKILAIVYGVYAVGKFSVSIYNLIVRRKLNLYYETLSYVGWISAVYTLSLFTNYVLIAGSNSEHTWTKSIMLSLMGFSIIGLALLMIVRSILIMLKNMNSNK